MNKTIRIDKRWNSIIPKLTRNQIFLVMIVETLHTDNEWAINMIRMLYGKKWKARMEFDYNILKKYVNNEEIKNRPNFNANEKKHKKREELNYFETKMDTISICIQSSLTKSDVQVLIWILNLYCNKEIRSHEFKIKKVLSDIFSNHKRYWEQKPELISALDKFVSIKYPDPADQLVIKYKINGKNLLIDLTPKSSKRRYYNNGK